MIRLSQGHLNLLATCPRKFQQVFLEQLSSPTSPEQQEKLTQGSHFHLILQQWQLGLPVQRVIEEDTQIQSWFTSFVQASPQILSLSLSLNAGSDAGPDAGLNPDYKPDNQSDDQSKTGKILQQTEHQRTLEFQGYLLTVIYDLLITHPQQAKILDWKTYPQPQNAHWLAQNWQTRLYPFVLAETSPYSPEQISMVYWFFQTQSGDRSGNSPTPQSLTLGYDRTRHEQTHHDLIYLLDQLTKWLELYQTGHPFPQVPENSKSCQECSFTIRCGRGNKLEQDRPTSLTVPHLSTIPEIPL